MSRWIMKNKKPVEDMSILENSIHPLILKLLYNRDVNTVDKVMAFLKPNIELLPSPLELYGVAEAVKLINTMGDAHIRVVGDYDV
ncbi:MAG: hypothetical protein GXZ11_02110, partial [Tissierellia bacterium]|nr:hypothetical protein [Tissierellia bacterium]